MSDSVECITHHLQLPRALGGGLTLRWVTPADIEGLIPFYTRIHSSDPEQPLQWLAEWARDLLSGAHPTTDCNAFTVVTDDQRDGAVVSSMCLISQTWAYEGISIGVGRPELVGTETAYRRRGLVRAQFDVLHALSAQRGELLQAISGIPWYYRQFGYEMAVDLGGSRRQYWRSVIALPEGAGECYRLRAALEGDIPFLSALYTNYQHAGPITLVRDEAIWRWEVVKRRQTDYRPTYLLIERISGEPVGYIEARPNPWEDTFDIGEIAAMPDHAFREICAFVGRALKARAEELNPAREKPIVALHWNLGSEHPAYTALGQNLEQLEPPYAWYLRVADLKSFMLRIAPVFQRRLIGSCYHRYSGTVRFSCYTDRWTLEFKEGNLVAIGTYKPKAAEDGDAFFPNLTFLQLLFGHRSFADLHYAWPDCYVRDGGVAVLLDILFPRKASCPIGLL